jgi:putative ABC transport system ATP-binding protein
MPRRAAKGGSDCASGCDALSGLIHTRALGRAYTVGASAVHALAGVNLDIGAGEFVAVMGPSGSGKSTLMNLLGLLDRPSAGSYRLAGQDMSGLHPDARALQRNRLIGFVFQSFSLLPRFSAQENVELPLVYGGARSEERRRRAAAALEGVGLAGRTEHWPQQLSGGEQQRVAIARAIVNDPVLLLADEPTGALDSRTGAEILALFQSLNRNGRTVVMVTHDPEVARHSRRVVTIRDGRVVGDGAVARPLDARARLESASRTEPGAGGRTAAGGRG